MRYPVHQQETITEAMLAVLLARPFEEAREYDFGAIKALIPMLDVRQCWMVMEWIGP